MAKAVAKLLLVSAVLGTSAAHQHTRDRNGIEQEW
jgi:hypothetical protein